LFDQRGCGRSLPQGALQHNHSAALVNDIEALRQHLGITRWLVVGGSWGAGLAVAYAAAHPDACLGLVLRGVFLGRAADINWFFKDAAQLLPDAWQQLFQQAPGNEADAVLQWLHAGLFGPNREVALARVSAWEAWEQSLSLHRAIAPRVLAVGDAQAALLLDKYRLQSHFLIKHCFWQEPDLLSQARGLSAMPMAIVHGRLDWICRAQAAWDLHCAVPSSRLHWVEGCGHNPFEPAMATALVTAIKHFEAHGNFLQWGGDYSHGQVT
jgi:proline iminopeptidase